MGGKGREFSGQMRNRTCCLQRHRGRLLVAGAGDGHDLDRRLGPQRRFAAPGRAGVADLRAGHRLLRQLRVDDRV